MKACILIVFLCCGCATIPPPAAPDVLPQLIYQAPLPPWPTPVYAQGVTLELMIRVTSDGSVQRAILLTPTGNTAWDSLALNVIHQWQFSPARMGTQPVACWIQQRVSVQFASPEPMVLMELVCSDRSLMDSLYALLTRGASFDSLARHYSVSASGEKGGFLGEIDVRAFPAHVRRQLSNLHVGDITKPLDLGQNLAIFKRLRRIR